FLGRFRIAGNPDTGIDGAQETDGIDATPVALGPDFPLGVLVVQDGLNDPSGDKQNFKIVDWREIKNALDLD
ncbi:MAG: phytase, partial [Aquisalinus sp.]|nr:phytase [Aquisalinus sp.]